MRIGLGRWKLHPAGLGGWLFVFVVLLFLFLPLLVVIPVSFSPGSIIEFPPSGLSMRWYEDFFGDQTWLDAAWLSLRLGICVATLSTVLGLMVALAMTRFLKRGRLLVRVLVLTPLIVPLIVTGIAMFDIMIQIGLARTFIGLLLAHTILALPLTAIVLESGLRHIDPALEDAAQSLGASPLRAFAAVTVPGLRASLVAAALFAFLTSWDEVVVVLFVGGATFETLPLKMFEFLETEVRPTIAAVSALLVLALVVTVAAPTLLRVVRRGLRLTVGRISRTTVESTQ
jgi:ABC-type spermidine/putrescine transport system permease subunit II